MSVEGRQNFIDYLKNNDLDQGWGFAQGDPEFWRFQDQLLVSDGSCLDLGAGAGRSSFFFAINGMKVTAYENSKINSNILKGIAKHGSIPIKVRQSDFAHSRIEKNFYDTVILDSTLIHLPSKDDALKLLDKSYHALKPGGHLYVRAVGKQDDSFTEMQYFNRFDPDVLSSDVFSITCGCSGEVKEEPLLFLGQTDLLQYALQRKMKIIHHQCMPEFGRMNVMYGENWQNPVYNQTNGMITVIAQKV